MTKSIPPKAINNLICLCAGWCCVAVFVFVVLVDAAFSFSILLCIRYCSTESFINVIVIMDISVWLVLIFSFTSFFPRFDAKKCASHDSSSFVCMWFDAQNAILHAHRTYFDCLLISLLFYTRIAPFFLPNISYMNIEQQLLLAASIFNETFMVNARFFYFSTHKRFDGLTLVCHAIRILHKLKKTENLLYSAKCTWKFISETNILLSIDGYKCTIFSINF